MRCREQTTAAGVGRDFKAEDEVKQRVARGALAGRVESESRKWIQVVVELRWRLRSSDGIFVTSESGQP